MNILNCKVCSKPIKVIPSLEGRKKYCSRKCLYIGRAYRKRLWIEKQCKWCKKIFNAIPSEVARGRAIFCSRDCLFSWRKEQRKIKCEECKKIFERHNAKRRYCSKECFDMALKKGKVHSYKEWKDKSGYLIQTIPGTKRTKFSHRVVWEKYYGKLAKGMIVHHLNGIKSDNRIENLCAMPREYHSATLILRPYQERIKQLERSK